MVLISIKPKYAKKIMDKEKTVEFRRSIPLSMKKGDKIFIYSSSPEKSLLGSCLIDEIDKDSIDNLWKKNKLNGGIDYTDFYSYYEGTSIGYGLVLTAVQSFSSPIPLGKLQSEISNFRVPQSYRYLRPEEIDILESIINSDINHIQQPINSISNELSLT